MRDSVLRRSVGVGALLLAAGLATAQPVLVTSPLTVGPSDTTILGVPLATAEITVRGTTLTMNGTHTIASLTLERSPGNQPGVLTHTANTVNGGVNGFALTVTGDVTIQGPGDVLVGSRIDVSQRGFPSDQGPGAGDNTNLDGSGGGHGGNGGNALTRGTAIGGGSNGSAAAPVTFGSGGGTSSPSGAGVGSAGAGGGCIRLDVGGTLTVDGEVLANGGNGSASWWDSGGGAGGSIWISAQTLAGIGAVRANGGNASATYGGAGGGGGGRVRIEADASTFAGQVSAFAGTGNQRGGVGSIVTTIAGETTITLMGNGPGGATTDYQDEGLELSELVIGPNAGVRMLSAFNGPITVRNQSYIQAAGLIEATSLEVESGGEVRANAPLETLEISVSGDVTIHAGAVVQADRMGYASGEGPGAAPRSSGSGGGGAYGGNGGTVTTVGNQPGGVAYGDPFNPNVPGSGGGPSSNLALSFAGAGAGGGVVNMIIGGTLRVDGVISTNGGNGTTTWYDSGAGSGGGVRIYCDHFEGTGLIRANGGNAPTLYGAGGGGGGRIAVTANTEDSSVTMTAYPGTGSGAGAPGTVARRFGAAGLADLYISGAPGAAVPVTRTPLLGDMERDVFIGEGVNVEITGEVRCRDFSTSGNAQVTHPQEQNLLRIIAAGNVTVGAGSTINANSAGYLSSTGPGAGGLSTQNGGGGAYGGNGGTAVFGSALGGAAYGTPEYPSEEMGSGGGASSVSGGVLAGAGNGGGAVHIEAAGVLTIDGGITADGGNGTRSWYSSGGGGGGGIFLAAPTIAGGGVVSARGGNGDSFYVGGGGGGGGGRIALYSCDITLPVANIAAPGGAGNLPGQAGTVYFGGGTVTITQQPVGGEYTARSDVELSVAATTTQNPPTLTYQWRRNGVALLEGDLGGRLLGVNGPTLIISAIECGDGGRFDCLVSDSCGAFPSIGVTVVVNPLADFNGDDGIDDLDIADFFAAFEEGDPAADVNRDDGIDDLDITFFFVRFEQGC